MNEEEQFIRQFILPEKQRKLIGLLLNPSRRRKYLGQAMHSCDFAPANSKDLLHYDPEPDAIYHILKGAGAQDMCYAISEAESLDGKRVELREALSRVVGKGLATILIFDPKTLGYYEGADMEERMILQKEKPQPWAERTSDPGRQTE